ADHHRSAMAVAVGATPFRTLAIDARARARRRGAGCRRRWCRPGRRRVDRCELHIGERHRGDVVRRRRGARGPRRTAAGSDAGARNLGATWSCGRSAADLDRWRAVGHALRRRPRPGACPMALTVSRSLVCLGLSCILASCGDKEARESAPPANAAQRLRPDGSIQLTDQDRGALGLVVAAVTDAELPDTSLRFGRVVVPPGNEAQIVAPVTGRIVQAPRAHLGSAVKAGARVLDISPSLDTADRIAVSTQSAERAGQIEAAARELVRADAEAARVRELTPHALSVAKREEAETAVATARARLDGLRTAQASSNRAQTQTVPVTTPISGVVSALSAEVGALANKGEVLARVLATGAVWVDVSVPPE